MRQRKNHEVPRKDRVDPVVVRMNNRALPPVILPAAENQGPDGPGPDVRGADGFPAARTPRLLRGCMSTSESCWTDIVTIPDAADWPALLSSRDPLPPESRLNALRTAARQRLIEAAQEYVLRIGQLAEQAGISLSAEPVLTGDPQSQPVIMTGHQPVMFHGGLTWKYHCTEQFAADQQAIGLAVSIDTDEGDPGAIAYPQVDPEAEAGRSIPLRRAELSWCDESGLLGFVKLCSPDVLQQRSQSIHQDLTEVAGPEAAALFQQVSEDYVRLAQAGATAAEASLICRWAHGIGRRMLELPLSAVSCFPEVLEVTAGILEDAAAFAEVCNQCLRDFRASHGIANQANPFPDLQTDSDRTELPFWLLDTTSQTRQRALIQTRDGVTTLSAGDSPVDSWPVDDDVQDRLNQLLLRGQQLIPRGALITSYLRLLFADLFVHGTGGGHYDAFTTELVRAWWKVEPPPFVVASASRWLFAERREQVQQLQQLNRDLRDLRYNPQRHFGSGVFAASVEQRLKELADRKAGIVNEMKSAHQRGKSAKDLGHQIQLISDEMRQTVDEAFSEQLDMLTELTPQTETVVNSRTWPWLLFPQSH